MYSPISFIFCYILESFSITIIFIVFMNILSENIDFRVIVHTFPVGVSFLVCPSRVHHLQVDQSKWSTWLINITASCHNMVLANCISHRQLAVAYIILYLWCFHTGEKTLGYNNINTASRSINAMHFCHVPMPCVFPKSCIAISLQQSLGKLWKQRKYFWLPFCFRKNDFHDKQNNNDNCLYSERKCAMRHKEISLICLKSTKIDDSIVSSQHSVTTHNRTIRKIEASGRLWTSKPQIGKKNGVLLYKKLCPCQWYFKAMTRKGRTSVRGNLHGGWLYNRLVSELNRRWDDGQ